MESSASFGWSDNHMERGMPERYETPEVTNLFTRLKKTGNSVLLLDYDGTLAPFQIERDRAYPYPGVLPLLEKILASGKTRVIIVSGRAVNEVQALIAPLTGIEIWGAHGLEHQLADGTLRRVEVAPQTVAALEQAEQWMKSNDMLALMEKKPGGIAAHWRGLSDSKIAEVRSKVLSGWEEIAHDPNLKLLGFEGGLELRLIRPDKGDAIAAVLKELPAETPVAFLGDDLTDEDGFRVLGDRGLPILVRDEYRETAARAWLRPPQELLHFFEQWQRLTAAS